jgi:hypothetical protein
VQHLTTCYRGHPVPVAVRETPTPGDSVDPVREPHLKIERVVRMKGTERPGSPAYLLNGFSIASWLRQAAEKAIELKTDHILIAPGLARRIADHLDQVEGGR